MWGISAVLHESASHLRRTYVTLVDLAKSRLHEYQVPRAKFVARDSLPREIVSPRRHVGVAYFRNIGAHRRGWMREICCYSMQQASVPRIVGCKNPNNSPSRDVYSSYIVSWRAIQPEIQVACARGAKLEQCRKLIEMKKNSPKASPSHKFCSTYLAHFARHSFPALSAARRFQCSTLEHAFFIRANVTRRTFDSERHTGVALLGMALLIVTPLSLISLLERGELYENTFDYNANPVVMLTHAAPWLTIISIHVF